VATTIHVADAADTGKGRNAKYQSLETELKSMEKGCDTVDGQNPAPPRMMIIPLFIGF